MANEMVTWSLPRGVHFTPMLAKRKGHKAHYVPSFEQAAQGKNDGQATGYVESRQGVMVSARRQGISLKSKTSLKRKAKIRLPLEWGCDLAYGQVILGQLGIASVCPMG